MQASNPIALSVPPLSIADLEPQAFFYWLDMPASAPPFLTATPATATDFSQPLQITAPSMTGQAEMVISPVLLPGNGVDATFCTGFAQCEPGSGGSDSSSATFGPFPIEVVP